MHSGSSDPTATSGEATASTYFVAHLPRGCTEKSLYTYFSQYGPVEACRLKRDNAGQSRAYGWVKFTHSFPELISKGPFKFNGNDLTVKVSDALVQPITNDGGLPRREENRRRRRNSRSRSSSQSSNNSSHGNSSKRRHEGRPPSTYSSVSAPPPSHTSHTSPPPAMGSHPMPTDLFVCLPVSICPPQFFYDPRVFAARLDRSRVGALTIAGPVVSALKDVYGGPSGSPSMPPPPSNPPTSTRPTTAASSITLANTNDTGESLYDAVLSHRCLSFSPSLAAMETQVCAKLGEWCRAAHQHWFLKSSTRVRERAISIIVVAVL